MSEREGDWNTIMIGVVLGLFMLLLLIVSMEYQKRQADLKPVLQVWSQDKHVIYQTREEIPEVLRLDVGKTHQTLKIETGHLLASLLIVGEDIQIKHPESSFLCKEGCLIGVSKIYRHETVEVTLSKGSVTIITAPQQVIEDSKRYRDGEVQKRYPFLTEHFMDKWSFPRHQTWGRDLVEDYFEFFYLAWRATPLFNEVRATTGFSDKQVWLLEVMWDEETKQFWSPTGTIVLQIPSW